MFNNLKSKLIIPTAAILLVLVIFIVFFVTTNMSSLTHSLTEERVSAASQAVRTHLSSLQEINQMTAIIVATSPQLVQSVYGWNHGITNTAHRQDLLDYLNTRMVEFDISSIVVTSSDGTIILRTHAFEVYNDSGRVAPTIAQALDYGTGGTIFQTTEAMPLSFGSTTPILDNFNNQIGVLSTVVDLSGVDFVDEIASIFNAEISVFTQEALASTTIRDSNNNRLTNWELPPQANQAVFQQAQSFDEEVSIGGVPHHVYYFPLIGWGGTPVGAFSVGFSNEYAVTALSNLQISLLFVAIGGILVSLIVLYLMTSKALRPVKNLAKTVKDVSAGNININRAAVSNDEIGALTQDVYDLVDIIKSMVDDLSSVHTQYINAGDMHYRIDDSKYQNSFKEMIALVNSLTESVTADIESIADTLKHIGNGEFDTTLDYDIWNGEWKIVPAALDELASNIKSVSIEVNAMIASISEKGDLNFKINTDSYFGGWREIMAGLNSIAKSVDNPLEAISIAMNEMKEGKFDVNEIVRKLSAKGLDGNSENYRGVFRDITVACSETITEVSSYISEISKSLAAIAAGDLTVRIRRNYVGDFVSIKDSINNIGESLNRTMSEISNASEQVLEGASQISNSANDLAIGAQEQASSIEELNATVEIITMQTQRNADSASTANELSGKSTVNAQEGNDAMKQMVEAMAKIKESSNNISLIVKTIQDIAFQTNLLALNASVEAARAGEHGKGFSVVADEVRTLAGRSQKAAEETTALIDDSIGRVERGSNIAESTAESLNAIVTSADEVLAVISSISASSKEQADAIENISEGLAEISRVVQNNSAASQETAAASQELNSQADLLRQLVAFFIL